MGFNYEGALVHILIFSSSVASAIDENVDANIYLSDYSFTV